MSKGNVVLEARTRGVCKSLSSKADDSVVKAGSFCNDREVKGQS